MEKSNNWFIHVEWITVILTLLGGFYLLSTDIKDTNSRVDLMGCRIDATNQAQAARTDQLYQMFIDLLKEGKR